MVIIYQTSLNPKIAFS